MPIYTYRREDGSTFEIRQKFLDDPLESCPTTGQDVHRVVQAAGVIFKGSGFYVNDSKAKNSAAPTSTSESDKGEAKTEKPEKTEKTEKKAPAASSSEAKAS